MPVALQVGRAQFAWIGRVEWALLAAVLLTVLLDFRMPPILLEVAGVIFLAQQFWLQPMLRTRSNLIIAGQDGQGGRLHLIFTLLELVKFLSLLAAATTSLWELIK